MTTDGYSHAFRHGKAMTVYVAIPSRVAGDSACPIRAGDLVKVRIIGDAIVMTKEGRVEAG